MDPIDRLIVETLQDGIAVEEAPFARFAESFGIAEEDLVGRIAGLLEEGVLTRFGPMFDAAALGGAFTLAAMSVPAAEFERVAALVNAHPEVAHNYEREHDFNMWFVIGAETPGDIARVIAAIEGETGLRVVNLPKLDEFRLELRLALH